MHSVSDDDDTFLTCLMVPPHSYLTFNYIHVLELETNHLATEREAKKVSSLSLRTRRKIRTRLCVYASPTILCIILPLSHSRYTCSTMKQQRKELNQQKLLRTSIVFFLFLFLFSSFLHAIII